MSTARRDAAFPDFSNAARQSGDGEVAMSVADTNRMRAALGLKPLKVDEGPPAREAKRQRVGADEEDAGGAGAAAAEQRQQRDAAELRERLAAAREERLARERLAAAPKLGEADAEGDDLAAWVDRSRRLEQGKRKLKPSQLRV